MSKAFVIKGVNFLANKLDTISFSGDVPCTGVSLNKSTTSLTAIGATETLVATLTPANTTDSVSWASSNTSAVTVNNGVITAVGIGSATITVTCGNQTATCTVSVVNTLSFMYDLSRMSHYPNNDTGIDYAYNDPSNDTYASLLSTTETTKKVRCYQGTGDRYPILLGTGATTLTINVPDYIRPTVWFCNSEQASTYAATHEGYDAYAKVVSGDAKAYDSSVPLGTRTISIPSGADSVLITVQYPNNTVTDAIMALVSAVAS